MADGADPGRFRSLPLWEVGERRSKVHRPRTSTEHRCGFAAPCRVLVFLTVALRIQFSSLGVWKNTGQKAERMRFRMAICLAVAAAQVGCASEPTDKTPRGPSTDPVKVAAHGTNVVQPANRSDGSEPLESRISTPRGFQRVAVEPGGFGAWLRRLPVRTGRPEVHLYDGRRKVNQSAHYAVLDVDVGTQDLQQCADAVIRLRAEYLFSGPCRDEIRFNFTSGHPARWHEWRDGIRPTVAGNRVSWEQTAAADASYTNFRRYLDVVFTYAGSASLERELQPVDDPSRPEVGDVFIEGGFPGHAVLVVDVAEGSSGQRIMLLAQGYMPAQDIHILKSFETIDPWYRARPDGILRTPEWDFWHRSLRRFQYTGCERTGGQTPD